MELIRLVLSPEEVPTILSIDIRFLTGRTDSRLHMSTDAVGKDLHVFFAIGAHVRGRWNHKITYLHFIKRIPHLHSSIMFIKNTFSLSNRVHRFPSIIE